MNFNLKPHSMYYHYIEDVFMDEVVSAAEANRRFSRLLRNVREGRSYVVTAHGRPVARIVPAGPQDRTGESARAALIARLRGQEAVDVGPWTRDELYADDP
ncbi:MAG TPA: type II toxin-antitoxin system Phd/YefM family antitoxin [Candidatus Acidoferrum sp.]|nr:type II toxin-antitoxin system Phd/YefM family antitoxin [Candidatus Acidoferrum sp.]